MVCITEFEIILGGGRNEKYLCVVLEKNIQIFPNGSKIQPGKFTCSLIPTIKKS